MADLRADIVAILEGGLAIRQTAERLAPVTRAAERAVESVLDAVHHDRLRDECDELLLQLRTTHHRVLGALDAFGAQVWHGAQAYRDADEQLAADVRKVVS